MNIWLIGFGEPLPIDGKDTRLRRAANLAEFISSTDSKVSFFSVSFDHYRKVQRVNTDKVIQIKKNYHLHLAYVPGYKKNVSIGRLIHYSIANYKFKKMMNAAERPDLILTGSAPIGKAKMVVDYAKKESVPVIIDIRDLWPEIFIEGIPKYLKLAIMPYVSISRYRLSKVFREASAIIGISEEFLGYGLRLAKRNKESTDKVIPTGYPDYNYHVPKHEFDKHWEPYGLSTKDFIVTFIGYFGRQFDFSGIIEASKRLSKIQDIKFVMCGLGGNLNKIRLQCGDNVIFPGWIEKNQIISLLSFSKLGLAPYIDSINYSKSCSPNKFAKLSMAPFISILIPIRNEAAYIVRCLDAVLAQDYPPDRMEFLLADGMSNDGTRGKLQAYQNKDPRFKIFENTGKIVATGLNTLTKLARGEILIRVDGHCVIAPDYVSNCVYHIQSKGVDGVGGPMRSIGEDAISQAIALAMSSKFGVGNSFFRTESGQTKLVDTVPFPAYTRAVIDQVGPYDEELVRNQDDEYNYRIRKAGGKILLAADIRSIYYSRGSLRKLWRQYYQYGFYKVRVLQKHPAQMRPRQFVPLVFVLSLIISGVLSLVFPWGWLVLAVVIGLYLLANLVVSFSLALEEGWEYLWRLPLAFSTLHISYGVGFLIGLFKFWNRWGDQQVPGVGNA